MPSALRTDGFSASLDSTNHGFCSTVVFTIEKNTRINGPAPLKPVLFKGQLYTSEWNLLGHALNLILFHKHV